MGTPDIMYVDQQVRVVEPCCRMCESYLGSLNKVGTIIKVVRCWAIIQFDDGRVFGFTDEQLTPIVTEKALMESDAQLA